MPPVDPAYGPPALTTVSSTTPATPLTEAEQLQLAQRYAPILYFHPDEKNFLQDPNTFLEQSSLRSERDLGSDEEVHGTGEVPPEELAGIDEGNETADSALFLDHDNEHLGDGIREGDLDNSQTLYSYSFNPDANGGRGAHEITYHFFYAYNDGPPEGIGEAQNHEGDWERMTIQVDPDTNQPIEVRYAAHEGDNTLRSGSDIPMEDGRPVVYVGKGSHASYPEPGQWHTEGPGVHDYTSDDGIRFDTSTRPVTDVADQPWYGGYVQWGERGSSSEIPSGLPFGIGSLNGVTSGPTGPSAGKGSVGDATERQPLSALESPPEDDRSWQERLRDAIPDWNGPLPPFPGGGLPGVPFLPGLPSGIDLPNLDPRDIDLPDVDLPNLDPRDIDLPDVDASDLDPRNLLG